MSNDLSYFRTSMIFAITAAYQPLPERRAVRVLCVLGKPTPQCLNFRMLAIAFILVCTAWSISRGLDSSDKTEQGQPATYKSVSCCKATASGPAYVASIRAIISSLGRVLCPPIQSSSGHILGASQPCAWSSVKCRVTNRCKSYTIAWQT